MRATIFVNGLIADYPQAERWLRADDYLVCADGGTRHCLALGRKPHALVGDLDSIEPAVLAQLSETGIEIERHPTAKAKTDLELAIEFAIHKGASELLLLGALGGRLDQTIANLLLLARSDWPIPISIAEGNELAQVLRGGERLTVQSPVDSTVSVLSLTEQVTGITYTGLEYPLDDFTLKLGSTRGMSNVVSATPATITIRTGLLLVVQAFDEKQ
jgi:thiamine pyrophosphokinase